MWCERCPDVYDRARLGTDEHQAPARHGYQILCEDCEQELIEQAEAEADFRQYEHARWVDEMDAFRMWQEDNAR